MPQTDPKIEEILKSWIAELGISVESTETPWEGFWRNYFNSGFLLNDAEYGAHNKLSLIANVSRYENQITQTREHLIQSLLEYLDKIQLKFQKSYFPFEELMFDVIEGSQPSNYLNVLSQHLNLHKYFPFKKIQISLAGNDDLVAPLKDLLLASQYAPQLEVIELIVNKDLSRNEFESLKKFYQDNPNISVILDIQKPNTTLPLSDENLRLQNLSSERHRQRNIACLGETQQGVAPTLVKEKVPKKIRPYKLRGVAPIKPSYDIVVEQQAESQYQLQLTTNINAEKEVQFSKPHESELDESLILRDKSRLITKGQYRCALSRGSLMNDSLQNSVLDKYIDFFTEDINISGMADRLYGLSDTLKHRIRYLTKEAVHQFHCAPHHYISGFSIDNLPPGFFLREYKNEDDPSENGLVIDFDLGYPSEEITPLTVRPSPVTHPIHMRGDLKQFMGEESELTPQEIENFKLIGKNGDTKSSTLSKLIQWMNGLNVNQAVDICLTYKDWFADESPLKIKDGVETLMYMQLLYHYGVNGIKYFIEALNGLREHNEKLYRHFRGIIQFFGNPKNSLVSFMSAEALAIIQYQLPHLTSTETDWWITLINGHIAATGVVDLVTLFNGFKYFLEEFRKRNLPLPSCPHSLAWYGNDLMKSPVTGSDCMGNMLVTLDRLLYMLSKGHPKHVLDQLANLEDLNLNQEGAWYAARYEGYHFFHAKMQLTPEKLGKDEGSYQVTLESFSKSNDPEMTFHRYVGMSNKIYKPYQDYVTLAESALKLSFQNIQTKKILFQLLAQATTGERGSVRFETTFKMLNEITKGNFSELLFREEVLEKISSKIINFQVKPTLDELFSLTEFGYRTWKQNLDVDELLMQLFPAQIKDEETIKIWESIGLYSKIPDNSRNSPKDTLNALTAINEVEKLKPYRAHLVKILMLFRYTPEDTLYESEDVTDFITKLQSLSDESLKTTLDILSEIEIDSLDLNQLPLLSTLNMLLDELKSAPPDQLFLKICQHFPRYQFKRTGFLQSLPPEFEGGFHASIAALSGLLVQYELPPLPLKPELSAIFASDIEALRRWYLELLKSLPGKLSTIRLLLPTATTILPDDFLISIIKSKIQSQMNQFIPRLIERPIALALSGWKDDNSLSQFVAQLKKPDFACDIDKESFVVELMTYNKFYEDLTQLLNVFIELRNTLGTSFNLNFLLNSSCLDVLTVKQLHEIFKSLLDLNLAVLPKDLLSSIFNRVIKTESSQSFVDAIKSILASQLSLKDKLLLCQMMNVEAPGWIFELCGAIPRLSVLPPSLQTTIINQWVEFLNQKKSNEIIRQTTDLLTLFADKNDPVLRLLFEKTTPEQLEKILQSLPAENKENFLRVVALGVLSHQESIDKINLQDLKLKSNGLLRLFEHHPYPNVDTINKFLGLSGDSLTQEITQYLSDPPGLRPVATPKQFDLSQLSSRIDNIRDLSNQRPLFYSTRLQLSESMAYINAVGHLYPLAIVGDEISLKLDSIDKLSSPDICAWFLHYKKILSDPRTDERTKTLVQLGSLALAREAMYRSTGKFPYETQILAVLNTLIFKGSMISQIRTGEGKGITTALMAAMRWVNGEAKVDPFV